MLILSKTMKYLHLENGGVGFLQNYLVGRSLINGNGWWNFGAKECGHYLSKIGIDP